MHVEGERATDRSRPGFRSETFLLFGILTACSRNSSLSLRLTPAGSHRRFSITILDDAESSMPDTQINAELRHRQRLSISRSLTSNLKETHTHMVLRDLARKTQCESQCPAPQDTGPSPHFSCFSPRHSSHATISQCLAPNRPQITLPNLLMS